MSCERLEEEYKNALARWAELDARLNGVALSGGRQRDKRLPISSASQEWGGWARDLGKRDALWQEYQRAEKAYRAARLEHRAYEAPGPLDRFNRPRRHKVRRRS